LHTFLAMSPPDRSWTVAPTLAWFTGALVVALIAVDGDAGALARRLTAPRDEAGGAPAIAGGPAPAAPDDDPILDGVGGVHEGGGAEVVAGTRGAGTAGGAARAAFAIEDVCVAPAGAAADACTRWATDGFLDAFAQAKAGTLGHPLRASFYGDSVVANDEIPGQLRTRLQTDLGDGGPGFVFVTPPHRFCAHAAIRRGASGTWTTHAVSTSLVADQLYGVGGSTTDTVDGSATIKLAAGKVAHAELYYLEQPGGGRAVLTADGAEVVHVDSAAATKKAAFAAATVDGGAAQFVVRADGRLRVFGLDLENDGGAVVDNLGIVSVNVKNLAQNRADHLVGQLAHRAPDLVLIMIGANEAQWLGPGDQDTRDYQGHYEAVLAPVRKARPDASCVVVSPTDQAFSKDGGFPSRPVMPVLVEAQRRAAQAQGCAFFSTYDWMGGKGSAEKWFKHGLVGSDFQHLSRRGATKLADAIYEALRTAAAGRHAPR
jgi:lysophospholipase L1-like esterase